jgi:hypothetical protein
MGRFGYGALALLIATGVCSAQAEMSDYQGLQKILHLSALRQGADGMNPKAPYAANYDETRTGALPLPDPLRRTNGSLVTTRAAWWQTRRPEIVDAFDREVYGRLPRNMPAVHWEHQTPLPNGNGATIEHRVGHVDNTAYPEQAVDIAMDVTLPLGARGPVPAVIVLSWTGRFANPPIPEGQGPDWRKQVLAAGWGYVELIPTTIQPDDPRKLREGIIGLVNKGTPRTPDQWGALRAWAWGTSQAIDDLLTDNRIDPKRIAVVGHSRYGKAALVAMAYDKRIAIGYISSSGAGGAKLLRRDFGERLENLAGEGEYHWMAGNFLRYAGPLTVRDLPVDAHDLIALCAPRPVFIGTGTKEAGDGWTDPRGMFLAAVAAGPVYRLLGEKDLGTSEFPAVGVALTEGALGFRQHPFGHTPQPNWANFLAFAKSRLSAPPP